MAATPEPPSKPGGTGRYWRLLRGFAAVSALATISSQLVFVVSYWIGSASTLSTVLGWLAGAVPNFFLNRRNWGSAGSHRLGGELTRFALVSVATFLIAAVATNYTEDLAHNLFADSEVRRVALVWGAYLGTYLLMFVVKFFLLDRVVFATPRRHEQVR
ncbi:putative flippase GtrA [Actinopolyspora lacussalsi]|nr:putative flippase GtrA [Actinopolyspora lacussalsi]